MSSLFNQGFTLPKTNPWNVNFEDDYPFPKVGYVSSLEGIILQVRKHQFLNGAWLLVDFQDTFGDLISPTAAEKNHVHHPNCDRYFSQEFASTYTTVNRADCGDEQR